MGDEDGSGEITADEMEEFLMEPGLRKYVEALNISAENTRMLFRLLDRDGSKKIDIEEFCEGCLRLQGEAKSFDVHSMIFTIRQFLAKWSEFTTYCEERFNALDEILITGVPATYSQASSSLSPSKSFEVTYAETLKK